MDRDGEIDRGGIAGEAELAREREQLCACRQTRRIRPRIVSRQPERLPTPRRSHGLY